jgi:hypothetical protein
LLYSEGTVPTKALTLHHSVVLLPGLTVVGDEPDVVTTWNPPVAEVVDLSTV